MRPGDMAAAATAKLPRFTTYAALFPMPSPFGSRPAKPALPPISISMDPALVDPAHLQALMLACAHSCAIRASASPSPPAGAAEEPVDLRKLCVALAHSFLVVSVFCSTRFLDEGDGRRFLGLDLVLGRQEDRRLVGFGRAVSDALRFPAAMIWMQQLVLIWKDTYENGQYIDFSISSSNQTMTQQNCKLFVRNNSGLVV
ncbi:hypothetical protein GUJ93_ZPchr0001g30608 [Zizania palustris]|uniref:Glucosamine-phosphate N-acetyltransferase n=1 Tax=Zizania palustris TaxID=103762 RepID=A0A8J5RNJ6_ZIZPA|nr:hypothetical protein GUJ93_ZPchr0001g30608 [Zizania palustris]